MQYLCYTIRIFVASFLVCAFSANPTAAEAPDKRAALTQSLSTNNSLAQKTNVSLAQQANVKYISAPQLLWPSAVFDVLRIS